MFKIPTVLQIRTEDMDLIAGRGIVAHTVDEG
jgi:(p)ppGpp synthase/HD superfamily hydrolase